MVSETCQRQTGRQPLAAASQPLTGHVTCQWQAAPASQLKIEPLLGKGEDNLYISLCLGPGRAQG